MERVVEIFAPEPDRPTTFAAAAASLFDFDPEAARADARNHAVLARESARMVLAELAERARVHEGPVRPREFAQWMNEIEAATGIGGAELSDPARIALIGTATGPEFDILLPVIEDAAARDLGIPSVRDRIERFVGV